MFGNRVISIRELAPLCRRLATALEAGVDIRRVFAREAGGRSNRALTGHLGEIRLAVNQGRSLSEALERCGSYFPQLVHELVRVGEETGNLPEVFRHLAEHYEMQAQLRRNFISSITWPMLQLTAAVFIVGFVIWILGVIGGMTNSQPIDILGFGLVGSQGALVWFGGVGLIALAVFLFVRAVSQGRLWARPLYALVLRLPVLGQALWTLSLSRLAWMLHLTLDTGMDLKRALVLGLRGSRNPQIAATSDLVVTHIGRGNEIGEALAETGIFPADFLDAVEVGERSGRLPESLGLLSRQYQEQARRALATLTTLAGFAVWALVAVLIILIIFRIFSFYLSTINDALQGI